MEILKTFFRGTPSDFAVKPFGKAHLLFLLIALIGSFLIINNRDKLKNTKKMRNLIVYTLLVQQIVLYCWYAFSGFFTIRESLPLYNCRIAMISIVIGELFNKEKAKYIGMYWGLLGATLALLNPIVDPFGFNHYTFYSFFVGHIFLLWGSLYLVLVEEKPVNEKIFKNVFIFTNLYHLGMVFFNKKYDANYCYMHTSPILPNIFQKIPYFVYIVIALFVFDLTLLITHRVLTKLSDEVKEDNLENNELIVNEDLHM